jgi:hypothetical protein
VELELEAGYYTEVAPTAAQRPEQIQVVVIIDDQQPAVGCYYVGRQEIVACEPVPSRQKTETPVQAQPCDTRPGHQTDGDSKPERLSLVVNLAECRTTTHAGDPTHRIHTNAIHLGEVYDDTAVAQGIPGDPMSTAPNGQRQSMRAGKIHCRDNVSSAGTLDDQRGVLVNDAIPETTPLTVRLISWADKTTSDPPPELGDRGIVKDRLRTAACTICCHGLTPFKSRNARGS